MNKLMINEGIKAVGIGKRGSKSLSAELALNIANELKNEEIPAILKGAFFGALYIKGIEKDEECLLEIFNETQMTPETIVGYVCPNAPEFIKTICMKILNKQTLDKDTAQKMGEFLFSNQKGDGARGLIASILRVRYETADEYEGLLLSMQQSINSTFCDNVPTGEPIVQLAEPFDGVDHSNLITPLLAKYLQSLNYRVVSLVGRNSGPKYGNNLLDLAKSLNANLLKSNQALADQKPEYGWYINQADMSPAIDHWVDLRRQIIKRPFVATLERFVNPVNADIIIASAFHPQYGEKMRTICQRAGFPGIIIIRNGLEGSMAFPLKRAAKILCAAKQTNGEYEQHEFEVNPEDIIGAQPAVEEKLTNPSLEKNIKLIQQYHQEGQTDYKLFNDRIKVTCKGLYQAIDWIQSVLP